MTKRADGFHENSEGHVAIVMRVSTGVSGEGSRYFEFVGDHDDSIIRLEWNETDQMQLYPQELVNILLRRNWAKLPNDAAVSWFENISLTTREEKPVEKVEKSEPYSAPEPIAENKIVDSVSEDKPASAVSEDKKSDPVENSGSNSEIEKVATDKIAEKVNSAKK